MCAFFYFWCIHIFLLPLSIFIAVYLYIFSLIFTVVVILPSVLSWFSIILDHSTPHPFVHRPFSKMRKKKLGTFSLRFRRLLSSRQRASYLQHTITKWRMVILKWSFSHVLLLLSFFFIACRYFRICSFVKSTKLTNTHTHTHILARVSWYHIIKHKFK